MSKVEQVEVKKLRPLKAKQIQEFMSNQPKLKHKFHKDKLMPSQVYQDILAKKKEVTPSPQIAKLHKAEDKTANKARQDA